MQLLQYSYNNDTSTIAVLIVKTLMYEIALTAVYFCILILYTAYMLHALTFYNSVASDWDHGVIQKEGGGGVGAFE